MGSGRLVGKREQEQGFWVFAEEKVQHLGKNGQVWDYSSASSSVVFSLGLSVPLELESSGGGG